MLLSIGTSYKFLFTLYSSCGCMNFFAFFPFSYAVSYSHKILCLFASLSSDSLFLFIAVLVIHLLSLVKVYLFFFSVLFYCLMLLILLHVSSLLIFRYLLRYKSMVAKYSLGKMGALVGSILILISCIVHQCIFLFL